MDNLFGYVFLFLIQVSLSNLWLSLMTNPLLQILRYIFSHLSFPQSLLTHHFPYLNLFGFPPICPFSFLIYYFGSLPHFYYVFHSSAESLDPLANYFLSTLLFSFYLQDFSLLLSWLSTHVYCSDKLHYVATIDLWSYAT